MTAKARPLLQRVGRVLLYGMLTVIIVLFGSGVLVLYPVVQDDVRLDRIVAAVALDWRDFGNEAAITRLQYEIDAQSIDYVDDDDCSLAQVQDDLLVHCEWTVPVGIPGFGERLNLWFVSEARVLANGDLI